MIVNKKQNFYKLLKNISEILPYTILKKKSIEKWHFASGPLEEKPIKYEEIVTPKFRWNFEKAPVWFMKDLEPIRIEKKQKAYLKLWFGGESLVLVDGKPCGEINEYHKLFNVTLFCDGKAHRVETQVMPRGLFGKPQEPIFSEAFLLIVDEEITKILKTIENTIKVANTLEDSYVSEKLLDICDEFLSNVWIPRDTDTYLETAQEDIGIREEIVSIWNAPKFKKFEGIKLQREFREQLLKTYEIFKNKLDKLKKEHPPIGTIHLVGHSHIDYAWLWPVEETKRKITRTFANATMLSKLFPEFVFSQSSAQMYYDLKEGYPDLFEIVKDLVKQNRWEPIGGMWVESDCNIPSVESLIRQFYYGQKFFEKEFGRKSKICWLPDVFGFSWILPQILRQADIEYFVTTKMNWNDTNEFPYDLCNWRGIDGSQVLYCSFNNPNEGYNGKIDPDTVYKTWRNFRQKRFTNRVLLSFGYGDGGGGPTEEMLENYRILKEFPGFLRLEMQTVEEYFKSLNLQENLPTWDGELYLECHRGTYTSQSHIKKLHKGAEDTLYLIEIISVFSEKNYSSKLDELWKIVLRNEFHDILPGSAIREVYEKAEKELSYVINKAKELAKEIIDSVRKDDDVVSILNLSSFSKKISFFLEKGLSLYFKGKEVDFQKTHDGRYIYFLNDEIEPFSKLEFEIKGLKPKTLEVNNILSMENEYLSVQVNDSGTVQIYDKEVERFAFQGEGNILKMHKNIPAYWDNWDIAEGVEKTGFVLKASKIEKIESGPVREIIRAEYEIEGTKIIQDYVLNKNSRRLDIKTTIDWHTRRALLRTYFPINVLTRKAKFDISGGFIERPTHKNTDYEKARFEVPAHRWIDLSQTDFGVSIITDSKYGYSVQNNLVSLSLIKAGVFPDFFAEEGLHEFIYSIYVHPDDDIKAVVKESEDLNKPILVDLGRLEIPSPILKITPNNFKVTSFRKNEDGDLVLRLVEILGTSGKLKIEIPWLRKDIFLCNILEEQKQKITLPLEYYPFKIYTFLLK